MSRQLPQSVVIVDRSRASGFRLRSALVKNNVTAHVFNNYAAALRLLERKSVDTVVVEFDTDRDTVNFCNAVKAMKVPVVYSSGPIDSHDLRQYGFNVMFQSLPKSPNLVVSDASGRARPVAAPRRRKRFLMG